MKIIASLLITALAILFSSCGGGSAKSGKSSESDSTFTADSIVKYYSNNLLLKEVTFKNGERNGITKTYYQGGQLYQTFWYVNGLREDSARWFYLEGQLFRTTPFRHDTIDGIQIQYYRNGRVKAKIGYKDGLRTTFFEEYGKDGKLVKGYPEIVSKEQDSYKTNGLYSISLELSDKSTKVKFYRGQFIGERFDTASCSSIKTVRGKATVILRKTGKPHPAYLSVIAEITTLFGNKYLTSKKIDLPYNDLN